MSKLASTENVVFNDSAGKPLFTIKSSDSSPAEQIVYRLTKEPTVQWEEVEDFGLYSNPLKCFEVIRKHSPNGELPSITCVVQGKTFLKGGWIIDEERIK